MQARLLCASYIHQRLSSKGLMSKRVPVAMPATMPAAAVTVAPPSCPPLTLLARDLWWAGRELERLHPQTYSDVSRRIRLTMTSSQLMRRALTVVLEGTFGTGVTWARVLSMMAIAGAFAEECVVQVS